MSIKDICFHGGIKKKYQYFWVDLFEAFYFNQISSHLLTTDLD